MWLQLILDCLATSLYISSVSLIFSIFAQNVFAWIARIGKTDDDIREGGARIILGLRFLHENESWNEIDNRTWSRVQQHTDMVQVLITFSQVTVSGGWQDSVSVSNKVSSKHTCFFLLISAPLPSHSYSSNLEQSSGFNRKKFPFGFFEQMSAETPSATTIVTTATNTPDMMKEKIIESMVNRKNTEKTPTLHFGNRFSNDVLTVFTEISDTDIAFIYPPHLKGYGQNDANYVLFSYYTQQNSFRTHRKPCVHNHCITCRQLSFNLQNFFLIWEQKSSI